MAQSVPPSIRRNRCIRISPVKKAPKSPQKKWRRIGGRLHRVIPPVEKKKTNKNNKRIVPNMAQSIPNTPNGASDTWIEVPRHAPARYPKAATNERKEWVLFSGQSPPTIN